MDNKVGISDYIFLIRPILLVPVWTFLLLGYFRASGKMFVFDKNFLIVAIAYTLLMASLYILNQIIDINADIINRKHLLLAEGYISKRDAWILFIILVMLLLLLILHLQKLIILFFLLSFLLGVLYSLPPFKIKGIPIIDFITNGIGYGFLNFSIGWMTHKPFSLQTIEYSIPYFLAVSAIFINTTIIDAEGDKNCGYLTTGIFLGQERALSLSTLFIIMCVVVSILVRDWICLVPAIVALPFFFLTIFKGDDKFIYLSIRIGSPLLVLITGIIFPYFLILSLLIYLFLRCYYRARFDIVYPSISSD